METTATSGNISTQYFGDKFNAENVEGKIHISVQVFIPQSVLFTINETLTLHVEKISMAEDSDKEVMKLNCYSDDCYIDPDVTETSKNITDPFPSTFEFFSHNRQVSQEEINDTKIDKMPGHRFTWKYDRDIQPDAKYKNIWFVRCDFKL